MSTIVASRLICAPAEQLFALSQDYSLRREWDPFTGSMSFLGGATQTRKGAQVEFRSRQGLTMVVEFVQVRPPKVVAMKMLSGPWFIDRFAGSWTFRSVDDGSTQVTFRYALRARPTLIGPALRWVLTREFDARLTGMKHAAESTDILARVPLPTPPRA